MRILVIGAHPDDEILGCGGTISKYLRYGHEVYICICTQAYTSKEDGWNKDYCIQQPKWQKDVDKFLKIKKRFNFPFPTVQLNNIGHGYLAKKINEVISIVKPDIVFTHYENDLNMDHVIVSKATQVACRPEPQTKGFRWKIKLLAYETLSSTPPSFNPNYYEILSKNDVVMKLRAYKLYVIESKSFRRTPLMVERLAKKRADEILVNYAEGFMTIREVGLF